MTSLFILLAFAFLGALLIVWDAEHRTDVPWSRKDDRFANYFLHHASCDSKARCYLFQGIKFWGEGSRPRLLRFRYMPARDEPMPDWFDSPTMSRWMQSVITYRERKKRPREQARVFDVVVRRS